MRANETQVPSFVIDILRAATVTEDRLTLNGQLDRKTYTATAEVLDRIGGKWDKKTKSHVFDQSDDVRGIIAEMIATAEMPRKNALAFFPTPSTLADYMINLCVPVIGKNVNDMNWLEPSAGEGAILDAMVRAGVQVGRPTAIEIDPARHTKLVAKGYVVHNEDFLKYEALSVYHRIAMNPPFVIQGDARAYIAHIEHAYKMLAMGGILVAIAPSSLLYGTDKRTVALRDKIESCGSILELEPDEFKASGTMVRTVLLTLTN